VGWGASLPVRYFTAISKASNAVDIATATRHTDTIQPAKPSCPTHLSSTLYLEALLTPKYLSLTAFHFYIFGYNFLSSTLLKPGNSLSLHHFFLCLGTPCHHTAMAKPIDYIHSLQHSM
jgi:hypothetical protein